MANLPYADETSPDVTRVLTAARRNRGRDVGLMHRQMAHVPALVDGFEAFSKMIRSQTGLESGLFGLVVLRTIQLHGDAYQWNFSASLGLKAELSEARLAALWAWPDSDLFSTREKAALAIVDEHCTGRVTPREAAGRARAVLRDPEIVAVCALMGWFLFTLSLTTPLVLGEDAPDPGLPVAIDDRFPIATVQDSH